MAGFGKRPWGSSPFGSLRSGITGVPEVKDTVQDTVFGTPGGTSTSGHESVLSLTEFEVAITNGNPGNIINQHHVSAYVDSFNPQQGVPNLFTNVLKAKTWSASASYVAYIPVLTAETSDFGAIVRISGQSYTDLSAYVFSYGSVNTGEPVDLPAGVQPHNLDDVPAAIATIDAVNLAGQVESVPGINLPGRADPVPSVDLAAFSGAHPPEDVPASIASVLPENLPVYIRGGFSATLPLLATLSTLGQVGDIQALLNVASTAVKDIAAKVRVVGRNNSDLPARVQPHREVDLPAVIITQRIRDIRAIVLGIAPGISDFSASIARIDSATTNMQGHLLAQFIALTDFAAAIRVVELGGTDVPSNITAVAPFFNINKVPLRLVPLTNIDADLNPFGGHSSSRASITPVHKSSTGTAEDSGFVTTASSYRLYLGTSRGLFIPPQNITQTRVTTHTNNYQRPDLHATISAWNQTDISASISVYPNYDIAATVLGLGIDHLSNLVASIGVYRARDIGATIAVSGDITNVSASLTTVGLISDLNAILVPFVDPLALHIISVSTQPIADLGALINYDSFVRCSPRHLISSVTAHIKPIVTGTLNNQFNMAASLTSTLSILDMPTNIIGRKRTRIRILNLTFTAKTRESERIRGSIVPVHKVTSELGASIIGLLHEFDLPATLTPIRYTPNNANFTATESLTNLSTGEVKDFLLSFRTQVRQYVYEEVTEAVYATDRGTWTIDLRTLIKGDSFFDRSALNREYVLEGVQEFYSLDEAIRRAVVILCERRQQNLSASLTVRGAVSVLSAKITSFSLEKVTDLHTTIMPVINLPDITASINTGSQSSSLVALSAIVSPRASLLGDLYGEIFGDISTDISAEITAS